MSKVDIKEEEITFTVLPQKIKGEVTLTVTEPLNFGNGNLKEHWISLFQQKLKDETIHINGQYIPLHLIEVKTNLPTDPQASSIQFLVESQERYKLRENKQFASLFFSKFEDTTTQLNELVLDRPESLKNHPIFEYWTIKNGTVWNVQRNNSLRPHNYTRGGHGFIYGSTVNLEHIEYSKDRQMYVPYGGCDTIYFLFTPGEKVFPQQQLQRARCKRLRKIFQRKKIKKTSSLP